jgi:hypothetical protein
MNEKFKLLAEKSGFLLWENEPWKPEGAIVDWSSQYDVELERFAELIVRKCAKICDDIDAEYGGEDVLASWCSKAIIKHFGVEK